VEMTRKRVYQDLEELMRIPCPYCEGRGRVLSPHSVAVRVRRELSRLAQTARAKYVVAEVHPQVASLLTEDTSWREALERSSGKAVLILSRPGIHLDRASVRQADSPEAAERQVAEPDDRRASMIWLDPVRGEGLGVPDDEEIETRPLRAGPPEAAGGLARAWRWLTSFLRRGGPPPALPHPAAPVPPPPVSAPPAAPVPRVVGPGSRARVRSRGRARRRARFRRDQRGG